MNDGGSAIRIGSLFFASLRFGVRRNGLREITLTGLILCAGALSLGASFDVIEVNVDRPDAYVFLAQGILDTPAVAVLDGYTLRLYNAGMSSPPTTITLAPGTMAVDIADTNGDGAPEVIAVAGAEICRYEIGPHASFKHEILFSRNPVFGAPAPRPYSRVIVMRVEDTAVLALPTAEALELWSLEGELTARHPWPVGRRGDKAAATSFSARAIRPNQAGRPGSLELRLTSTASIASMANAVPQMLGLEASEPPANRSRAGTPLQARDAALRPLSAWPWFPLRGETSDPSKVFFAFGPPGFTDTLLRVSLTGSVADSEPSPTRRRYAGTLLLPGGKSPDLNADGFADVVLWSAPRPGKSIQTLLRAVSERVWPVRLTAHLYATGKKRHEPRPAGAISFRAPLAWFLDREWGAPVRNFCFLDVDGDGGSDLGISTGPKTFGVWRYAEKLDNAPDWVANVPGEIAGIEILDKADSETGADLVALRVSGKLLFLSIP
jgi:hypothetical protein